MDKALIKEELLAICKARVAESITSATDSLARSISSMHGETKSSAGDKFETSRAMLQAEQDRIKTIIIKAKGLEHQLSSLAITPSSVTRAGSLVITDRARYFISVGLGKIIHDETQYYALSPAAPIGQLLMNKKAGDSFTFNGKAMQIISVD